MEGVHGHSHASAHPHRGEKEDILVSVSPALTSNADEDIADAEGRRIYSLRDLWNSVLPFVHRVWHAYLLVLGTIFAAVFTLHLMLQAMFSFLFADLEVPVLSHLVYLILVVLIAVLGTQVVDAGCVLVLDTFSHDSFIRYRRKLLLRRRSHNVELLLWTLIVLSFDVIAPLVAAGYFLAEGTVAARVYFFVAAVAVALFHMLGFLGATWLHDAWFKVRYVRRKVDVSTSIIEETTVELPTPPQKQALRRENRKLLIALRVILAIIVIIALIFGLATGGVVVTIFALLVMFFAIVVYALSYRPTFPPHVLHGLGAFAKQHCGIERRMVMRTCILLGVTLLLLIMGVLSLHLWIALAPLFLATVFLSVLAIVTWRYPTHLVRLVLVSCVAMTPILIIIAFAASGWKTGLFSLVTLVCVQGALVSKSRRFIFIFSVLFLMFIVSMCIVFALGYGGAIAAPTGISAGTKKFTYPSSTPYPFCTFGLPAGLTTIDYTMFSLLAYKSGSNLAADFKSWFSMNDWRIVSRVEDRGPTFVHFDSPTLNHSVIAIRGTASQRDAAQDLAIWAPTALFQLASGIMPMKSLIILVDAAAFAVAGVQVDVAYYQPINDYLKNNVFTIRDRSQVSVTGHSLGGGLAAIVAGKNSIRAVSVSAPGVLFTSKAISLDNDVVRRMWITITSENDIVPTFDQTVTLATIFSIKCLKSEVGCHLIPGTLCELMKGCGDVYNRGVKSEDCDADTV